MSCATAGSVTSRACFAAALLGALAACQVSDGQLGRVGVDGLGGGASCTLPSPLVTVKGRSTCTGRLASSLLSNALCTCGNVQVGLSFVTRGFDSRQGPYDERRMDAGGASVAVNGAYLSARFGTTNIGGSLSLADASDVAIVGSLNVGGDLWAAGNVSVTGSAVVARNAWFGGDFMGTGPLTVRGSVRHEGTLTATPVIAASPQQGPVDVPKACPCANDELLDIGAIVDAAQADNDNGALRLDPQRFAAMDGASELWNLPCGRAYLTGIEGKGSVTVRVNGMSAIFVDGSIDVIGSLLFEIAPGAELDVFVKGDAAVIGKFTLASEARPSAGRLWVGGAKTIGLLPSPWVGTLYAPHAAVTASLGLEVRGAILAKELSSDVLNTTFLYDRSILDAGATCAAPPPAAGECSRCGTCSGGAACISGMCGACVTDADCCSLSICANGSCAPWLGVQSSTGP